MVVISFDAPMAVVPGLSEQRRAPIDNAPAAFEAGVDGFLVTASGFAGCLEMFHDRLAFARVQFDHGGIGLGLAVGVYKFLGAHQSEEGKHSFFAQNCQIGRRFVAHSKESPPQRSFSELRLNNSTTASSFGKW